MKFIDLCSGIGAAHLAFKKLSCQCVGYAEIDKKAEKTYKLFFGSELKNYGDLMKIKSSDLPSFDILLAGFPCQSFSVVGQRKGFIDERGQIIFGIKNILKEKKPKFFLLENVKGILSAGNGDVINVIVKGLEAQGYNVKVDQVLKGKCVSHEVDVVATKGKEVVLVEAKFRNRSSDDIGVQVPLYMNSRFADILSTKSKEERRHYRCFIVTNTRFSVDATTYVNCIGNIELIGWHYPKDRGLEHMIESTGLHPITILNLLTRDEKLKLFEKGLVVCQDIDNAPQKLNAIGLSKNKADKVIAQAGELCRLQV